jgi:hypothetical protein
MIRAAFLRRMAGAALACALLDLRPPRWEAPETRTYPVLHSDGVHDDAPALQALVDGEPVFDAQKRAVVAAPIHLHAGRYRLGATIDARGRDANVLITNAWFQCEPWLPVGFICGPSA